MLLAGLNLYVHISEVNIFSLHAAVRKGGVDVPTLARNVGISLEVAKRTRAMTTQRGVKSMIYPILNLRRITNDRHMRYRRLPMTLFTDIMFAKLKSRKQKNAAQIFCTRSGWTRAHPLSKEADAHEAMSLIAHRDSVPELLVMD
jgi:cytochrome P450